ncbi:site-specific DNA-methyltransferase [Pseudoalteromonas sp. A3]|uniref:site-specific DNA-methyltransferase n=1 Tax=Pseudoalteromonas sp. A3 TaxID=142792 RepID=UPI00221F11AB|nr:site-specific DNA-methyltransferase [Pseudoalteromonas sp. A3]MCW1719944.1 site-specific DNA-methyltransferase [Pseudoalteromonas sp. A3]
MNEQKNLNLQLDVAAKHVTHSGGKGEYLHDWFAYLEGYSSEFVRSVHQTYMPNSKTILEPFAGVGTTPLTLGIDSVNSLYCEVNPAMRRVINAKISVASLPPEKKKFLCSELLKLADELPKLVDVSLEDVVLHESYKNAFGKSKFFSEKTYNQVLKLRSLNNSLILTEPLLGKSFEIAVISRLLKCSLLKRAGDVRYKTEKELAKGVPELISSISEQLRLMAKDCLRCPQLLGNSSLFATNAKNIIELDHQPIDGVITSPPYLNGTNYFRNTKLELWYMGDILNNTSLRYFRDEVVTSGINDVTKNKGNSVHPFIDELVSELRDKAYDGRIAKMVSGYFDDMNKVFKGISKHLVNSGIACIDIGDSIYAGIHVPTHDILSEIASESGLHTLEIKRLRTRRSKDGTELAQSLIVLEKREASNKSFVASFSTPKSKIAKWENFKETLPHLRHPYTKRSWGNGLHSVCSYQGKMKPALAHKLVETFTVVGESVLDPFSGSGTIPFEAALMGRNSFGLDIGLLATTLSNAKMKKPNAEKVEEILLELESHIEKNSPSAKSIEDSLEVKFNKTIPEYFHEDTLKEVLCARDFFLKNHTPKDSNWALVMSCMLHILHGNRPYALSRNSHPITPYAPTGDYIYKNVVEKLRNKVQKSLDTDRGDLFLDGHCFHGDILKTWPSEVKNLDAIITSPPFFDSTKFYMTNWMRYWFCGWDKNDFKNQPLNFIEVMQKKTFDVYDFIFKSCHEKLKVNGFAVFHLGHSDKCDMAKNLEPIASKYFKVIDMFTESVEHCESHGISDKGGVKGHQYLILQK